MARILGDVPTCPLHSGIEERTKATEQRCIYAEQETIPDLYKEVKEVRTDMEKSFKGLYKMMVATLLTALGSGVLVIIDMMVKHVSKAGG